MDLNLIFIHKAVFLQPLTGVQSLQLNLEFVLSLLSRDLVLGVTGTLTVPAIRNAAKQETGRSVLSLRGTVRELIVTMIRQDQ